MCLTMGSLTLLENTKEYRNTLADLCYAFIYVDPLTVRYSSSILLLTLANSISNIFITKDNALQQLVIVTITCIIV